MNIYRNKITGYFSNLKDDQFTELFNGNFKIGDEVCVNAPLCTFKIDRMAGVMAYDSARLPHRLIHLSPNLTSQGEAPLIYRNPTTGYFSNLKDDQFTELFTGNFKIGDKVTHVNTRKCETVIKVTLSQISTYIDRWYWATEYEPHATSAAQFQDLHQPGAKDDESKPLPQVVLGGFANALQGVTHIGTFGARKYSRDGWKAVPDAQDRYTGALLRHLLEHLAGRTIDEESGFTHLRHIAWNALALCELDEVKGTSTGTIFKPELG